MANNNYNSNRSKLELPEYGRNILQMVDSLKSVQDREKRNEMARTIINVMGNINPTLRDSNDYRHKLWDHLFIMADFDLDIDSPYNIPNRDTLNIKPAKLDYRQQQLSKKQYGKNIRNIIKLLPELENEELRNSVMIEVAKFMKFKSYEYNREYPSDEVIIKDLKQFSNNTLEVSPDILSGTKINYSLHSIDNLNNHQSSSTQGGSKQGGSKKGGSKLNSKSSKAKNKKEISNQPSKHRNNNKGL